VTLESRDSGYMPRSGLRWHPALMLFPETCVSRGTTRLARMITTSRLLKLRTSSFSPRSRPTDCFRSVSPLRPFGKTSRIPVRLVSASVPQYHDYPQPPYSDLSRTKGKQRADDASTIQYNDCSSFDRHVRQSTSTLSHPTMTMHCASSSRIQIRYFHTTSRRSAIPLIPAALGIIKVSLFE